MKFPKGSYKYIKKDLDRDRLSDRETGHCL